MRDDCSVCGWRPVFAAGRCTSDYFFHRRHKRDRTEAEVVANGLREEGRMARRKASTR